GLRDMVEPPSVADMRRQLCPPGDVLSDGKCPGAQLSRQRDYDPPQSFFLFYSLGTSEGARSRRGLIAARSSVCGSGEMSTSVRPSPAPCEHQPPDRPKGAGVSNPLPPAGVEGQALTHADVRKEDALTGHNPAPRIGRQGDARAGAPHQPAAMFHRPQSG